jgi:LPXTG-motif cell wall-anchored protein
MEELLMTYKQPQESNKYKMWKSGKVWVVGAIAGLAIIGATGVASADTIAEQNGASVGFGDTNVNDNGAINVETNPSIDFGNWLNGGDLIVDNVKGENPEVQVPVTGTDTGAIDNPYYTNGDDWTNVDVTDPTFNGPGTEPQRPDVQPAAPIETTPQTPDTGYIENPYYTNGEDWTNVDVTDPIYNGPGVEPAVPDVQPAAPIETTPETPEAPGFVGDPNDNMGITGAYQRPNDKDLDLSNNTPNVTPGIVGNPNDDKFGQGVLGQPQRPNDKDWDRTNDSGITASKPKGKDLVLGVEYGTVETSRPKDKDLNADINYGTETGGFIGNPNDNMGINGAYQRPNDKDMNIDNDTVNVTPGYTGDANDDAFGQGFGQRPNDKFGEQRPNDKFGNPETNWEDDDWTGKLPVTPGVDPIDGSDPPAFIGDPKDEAFGQPVVTPATPEVTLPTTDEPKADAPKVVDLATPAAKPAVVATSTAATKATTTSAGLPTTGEEANTTAAVAGLALAALAGSLFVANKRKENY